MGVEGRRWIIPVCKRRQTGSKSKRQLFSFRKDPLSEADGAGFPVGAGAPAKWLLSHRYASMLTERVPPSRVTCRRTHKRPLRANGAAHLNSKAALDPSQPTTAFVISRPGTVP